MVPKKQTYAEAVEFYNENGDEEQVMDEVEDNNRFSFRPTDRRYEHSTEEEPIDANNVNMNTDLYNTDLYNIDIPSGV